ncbi:HTH-type transcriptional regulator YidZ [Citrobacter sp. T1.2D-1]|nr:HTH-type transcriptional regulator YidZ [Citrobacter sp. T1.2D-1]
MHDTSHSPWGNVSVILTFVDTSLAKHELIHTTVITITNSTKPPLSPILCHSMPRAGKTVDTFSPLWHNRSSHSPRFIWLRENINALYHDRS